MGFPGKNIGAGGHFPLQGIFPTQGLNRCLLYRQADPLPLRHLRSPLQSPYHVFPSSFRSQGKPSFMEQDKKCFRSHFCWESLRGTDVNSGLK